MHIGIVGNIGCGKTTLTRKLCEYYGWTPCYESVAENPYLADYYSDIPRWSFNVEVYFLAHRFNQVLEIAKSDKVIVQDRTLLEGVEVFVTNNYRQGNLSERDYSTYMSLFRSMISTVKQPDLIIYIRSSVAHLVDQINKRGRDYEQSMSLDYLSGLNDLYEKWISEYPGKVLIIPGDKLDFENRPEDFAFVTDRVDASMFGLFNLN